MRNMCLRWRGSCGVMMRVKRATALVQQWKLGRPIRDRLKQTHSGAILDGIRRFMMGIANPSGNAARVQVPCLYWHCAVTDGGAGRMVRS